MTDTTTTISLNPFDTIKKKESSYWNEQFSKCKSLREPYEKNWYLNMAFYMGRQYVQWAPSNAPSLSVAALVEPPVPRYRVRVVANKVKPAIRTELTKLTKEEPIWYCPPATTEPQDIAAAKAAEVTTDYLIDELKFKWVRRKATFWALMCGTSFVKTACYVEKPKASDIELDPNTGQPLPVDPKHILCLDHITAFHLFVPLLQEEDIQKQPYVIHARLVPVIDVERQWGIKVKPSETFTSAINEQKFLSSIGIKDAKSQQNKEMCFIKEIYVKPNARYPEGALLIYAEDTLVYSYGKGPVSSEAPVKESDWTESKFPYAHGMYPFSKIDHIPSGAFYSTSVIEDMIPLQKEYNKTRSQIVESKNRMAFPQMAYVKGSIDPNKMTSEPGLMIPVAPGMDFPKEIQAADIPSYVVQELDRTLRDMDDLTGQYEVSKGRTPPGVEAASAIAYLQEENDSKLYHTVASIEEATESVGQQLLAMVAEFWSFQQIQEVVSKNNTFEAMMFKMANFEKHLDIKIETGSMAPKSRAARQAFMTDLMKMGLIPPEKGLRYLEMNETNRLYEEIQADAKHAQRENFRMSNMQPEVDPMTQEPVIDPATGQPVVPQFPINVYDNHDVHIYEHGLFMKSQTFELLDQGVQQILINHYMSHMTGQIQLQQLQGMQNAGIAGNSQSVSGEPDPAAGGSSSGVPAAV